MLVCAGAGRTRAGCRLLADTGIYPERARGSTLARNGFAAYTPGFLLQAPDHVREALYAALNLHCTFRADKQQATVRATLTDTTPGIVAALIADPRTDAGSSKRSPGPLDDPNNSAMATETPWISPSG